jgi:hypothetical protein
MGGNYTMKAPPTEKMNICSQDWVNILGTGLVITRVDYYKVRPLPFI